MANSWENFSFAWPGPLPSRLAGRVPVSPSFRDFLHPRATLVPYRRGCRRVNHPSDDFNFVIIITRPECVNVEFPTHPFRAAAAGTTQVT